MGSSKDWYKMVIHVLGSLVAFFASVITIYQFSVILPMIHDKEYKEVIVILSLTVVFLMIMLAVSLFTNSKMLSGYQEKLIQYPREIDNLYLKNESLIADINTQILSGKVYSNSIHNIMHYLRDLLFKLEVVTLDIADENTPIDERKASVETTFLKFDRFLINLLENVVAMNATYTKDRCSACIKLINNGMIKTLCRDSLSFRARKVLDVKPDGTVRYLNASENTAFRSIINPFDKATTFCSDDLSNYEDVSGNMYHDKLSGWENLYNACLVAPIGLNVLPAENTGRNTTLIKGFLWVDNMRGGFNTKENIDHFCGIADILFVLFAKIEYLMYIWSELGGPQIEHPSFDIYKNWPNG